MQGDGSAGRWSVGTNWPSGRQRRGDMTRASALVGERVGRGQWTGTEDVSDRDGVLVVDAGTRERRSSSTSTNGAKISDRRMLASSRRRNCIHSNGTQTRRMRRGLRVWKVCRKWTVEEGRETETSGANPAVEFRRKIRRVRSNSVLENVLILVVLATSRMLRE